jgi:hypothetical protein
LKLEFLERQTLTEGTVLTRDFEAAEPKELGKVKARFSTRKADRHGTVFLPSAYVRDLPVFQANPVMFLNHDSRQLPIGRFPELRVDDYALAGLAEFDMEDELAARIAGKYHRGFMRGFSVRIQVLEAVGYWSSDEQVATLPPDIQKMLRSEEIWACITRAVLLEISACGLQSNPDAISERALDPGFQALHERIAALENELNEERAARADLEAAWAFAHPKN